MGESESAVFVVAILFLFTSMVLGGLISFIQTWSIMPNAIKKIPYTVLIFLLGFLIGATTIYSNPSSAFIKSIKIYDNFDPQLILYVFIPALIFGEVANLNMHHLKSTIYQGIILAGPGALIGALLLAFFIVNCYMLPYPLEGWSVNTVYLFASILCATDPVSVISLLSKMELFRSQKLKYIITSEALFNDAMALCLYTIFLSGELIDSTFMSPLDIFIYSIKVIFISPLIGIAFGLCSLILCIQVSSDNFNNEYTIIKIIMPICAAYLSFFVGNYILEVSGILSCYFTGLMYSWLAPSFFKDNESVHSIWHALEWIANTFVFLVAGMVIGYRSLVFFNGTDIANIFVIFILIQVIRCIMVLSLYPSLYYLQKGCTLSEASFIAFSGLRGAICISLGLSFSLAAQHGLTKTSAYEGQRFVFYIGAIAALTLIFNATCAEWVLEALNLSENTKPSPAIEVLRHYTKKRLIDASTSSWLEIPIIHRKIIITKCQLLKEVDMACEKNEKILKDNFFNPTIHNKNSPIVRNRKITNNQPILKAENNTTMTRQSGNNSPIPFRPPLPNFSSLPSKNLSVSNPTHTQLQPPPVPLDIINQNTSINKAANNIESELHNIMLQKLKAHEAKVEHANILRLAQEMRDKHTLTTTTITTTTTGAAIISSTENTAVKVDYSPELMESVRCAFLECVRSYYWTRVQKAIIERHSYVARTLIASVDLGLETTHTPGLQDWDYIDQITKSGEWYTTTPVIKDIYGFLQKHISYLARYEQNRKEDLSSILYLYISAHLHAQLKIPYYFGDDPTPDTIEQAVVVLESNDLVKLASTHLLDLQGENSLLEYRKSKDKTLQILSLFENMVVEFREEAVITNYDFYHFQESIKTDRMNLEKLFSSKQKFKKIESEIVVQLAALAGNRSPAISSFLETYTPAERSQQISRQGSRSASFGWDFDEEEHKNNNNEQKQMLKSHNYSADLFESIVDSPTGPSVVKASNRFPVFNNSPLTLPSLREEEHELLSERIDTVKVVDTMKMVSKNNTLTSTTTTTNMNDNNEPICQSSIKNDDPKSTTSAFNIIRNTSRLKLSSLIGMNSNNANDKNNINSNNSKLFFLSPNGQDDKDEEKQKAIFGHRYLDYSFNLGDSFIRDCTDTVGLDIDPVSQTVSNNSNLDGSDLNTMVNNIEKNPKLSVASDHKNNVEIEQEKIEIIISNNDEQSSFK